MAHSLQHRQAAQIIALSSACTGKHRSDGPKAENALTLKPDYPMGQATKPLMIIRLVENKEITLIFYLALSQKIESESFKLLTDLEFISIQALN